LDGVASLAIIRPAPAEIAEINTPTLGTEPVLRNSTTADPIATKILMMPDQVVLLFFIYKRYNVNP
jgi:hypothetical protein